jgi:hypothetical protein
METMDHMRHALRKVRRRIALQQWFDFSVTALFYASLLACAWLLLARMFPVLGDPAPVAFALWGIALAAAAAWAFWKRPSLDEAALAADLRLGLRERFTSSLQLASMEGEMVAALHRDAQRHLDRLDVRRDFRLSPSPLTRWLVLPLVIFGVAYVLLPEMDLFGQRERILEAKVRQEARVDEAKRLEAVARVLEKKPNDPLAPGDTTAQELEKLAKALQRGELTEKQAMARVSKLSKKLANEREEMQSNKPKPTVDGDLNQLKNRSARDMAKAIQQGDMKKAAEKMKEMQEKLKQGDLTEEQKKALSEDMKKLSEMMGGQKSQLSQDMAKNLQNAGENLKAGDMDRALENMQAMEMSMEDLSSALDQMAKLDSAMEKLGEWKQAKLGPSKFCRECGKSLKPCEKGGKCDKPGGCEGHECAGTCAGGQCKGGGSKPGSGNGLGMGGGGRGQGNEVGDLPDDATVNMSPSVLPGEMAQGKLLADMIQRTAPDVDQESTVELAEGAFVQVQREAEQALTKEEIPAGSKEFVRQYFGTLEPNGDGGE